jgi:hypothetical protein
MAVIEKLIMNTKNIVIVVGIILIGILGFFALNNYIYQEKQADTADDYKNVSYVIGGERIQLADGVAEAEASSGSASKIITRHFGNELYADLNDDGREDVVFLLTQDTGGSGTFYYAVAALNTKQGWVGSDGYLLGDRIAPQTIEESQNPRHQNVIVANYADRAPGEPMTAAPSVGKSVYLKLDRAYMQWGVVEPDFEGESLHIADPVLAAKFDDLSQNGNSNCSLSFKESIPTLPEGDRLQGSCCAPMSPHRYEEQVKGLEQYEDISVIPPDPYDIDAKLAAELMGYYDMELMAEGQTAYDYASANSHEKGPCCCKCWRWYVYGGLAKNLIRDYGFTGEQITDVWNLSDGCGGEEHYHG